MAELDLDALERDWTEGNFMNELDAVRAAQRTIPALIKRLREAETETMNLTHEITGHLGTIAGLKRNAKDYRALKAERDRLSASEWIDGKALADQAQRIRELERVREAATEIINWSTALYVETHDREYWTAIRLADAERLRTALATMAEANQRSLGDEQIIDEQDIAIKRLTAKIDRLERVHKAAARIHHDWRLALPDAPFEELDAALAAVEEVKA